MMTMTRKGIADAAVAMVLFLMGLGDSHPDGLIAGKTEARCTYGHGFSMMFLAQCYGMEQTDAYEKSLKHTLDRAIKLVARGEDEMGHDQDGDSSPARATVRVQTRKR